MILLWVPFSTLVRLRSISKHCEELLSRPSFVSAWKNNNITETGLLIELLGQHQNHFAYKFINRTGHTSLLHLFYPEYRYTIECTVSSIIFLSKYCPVRGHKDYYIANPFIKRFSNIGIIDIGDYGFFSLIGNTGQQKHGWILVRHRRTLHGPKFFICSNVQRVWRETIGADGEPTAPKDAIFYKGKIY